MSVKSRAQEWLEVLLRFDTSNPPGNEAPAIDWIAALLLEQGIQATIVEPAPGRKNLVAELPGASDCGALLLSSHIDVVPVEDASYWRFPPFSAAERDNMLWGRGALDMKFKTAFDLEFITRLRGKRLNRPVKLVVLADEEQGGVLGVQHMLREHRELMNGEYVINELGGFNVTFGSVMPFLIQAGEKGRVHLRIHVSGPSGHASMPTPHSSIAVLSKVIAALDDLYFGFTLCGTTRKLFAEIAAVAEPAEQSLYQGLLAPASAEQSLLSIPSEEMRAQLRSMICNTINATRIGGGFQLNVIPSTSWCDLDCRIVPGVSPKIFVEQIQFFLKEVLRSQGLEHLVPNISVELLLAEEGYEIPGDDPLLLHLAAETKLRLGHGSSKSPCLPYLLPASSDNSHYHRAGIRPIGFSPLNFPPKFQGFMLAHSINERIPLKSFEEGLDCYCEAIANVVLR
jgi:acetylornithine deacetylase/succinyl-diaminopimelate desuccinylase-like protein